MSATKTMTALIKREFLEGKNGYFWTPVILSGVTVVLVALAAIGVGSFNIEGPGAGLEISNLAEALETAQARDAERGSDTQMSSTVTLIYWMSAIVPGLALPFVILFSLLGALYEERRDKSILFWKSMPVADWQEVLAKLLMPAFGAPLIFLGITFALQVVIALLLSIIVLVQGGPALELWPIGLMVATWAQGIAFGFFKMLWMMPVLTWLLFVSAFASRLPFLFALVPPLVLIAVEGIFFGSSNFAAWLGAHLGGWQFEDLLTDSGQDLNGPRDMLSFILGISIFDLAGETLGHVRFWIGMIVSGAFFYGSVRLRQRAI